MLFHRCPICLLNNSCWISLRYIWKKMAICFNYDSTCFCLPWISYCNYSYRALYLHVFAWSIFSWKNDYWLKFCIWILDWKMDILHLAFRLDCIRSNSYINCSLFLSYFQKNIIHWTCSFDFCCMFNIIDMHIISWISQIQLFIEKIFCC